MKKKLLCGVVAGLLAASCLAGCGSKKEVSGDSKEKVRIRMTYGITEIDGQNNDLDVIFEEFYKKYPNTEVVLEEGGTALMAKIAANDAPDIIRLAPTVNLPTYVKTNVLMPLDDLLKESELYDESDIYELPLNMFRYDGLEFGKGPIYGVPKDWSPEVLWVNTDALEEAGVPVPTMENPWTFSEYTEYAKKLTKKNGNEIVRYGCEDDTVVVSLKVEKLLNLHGKTMWEDDYKKINLKNNKDAYDMLKKHFDMQKAGYQYSKPLYGADFNANASVVSGDLAMYTSGLYSQALFKAVAEDLSKIQICPTPVTDGTTNHLTNCNPTGAGIYAKTKNIDEVFACWEFIHLGELSAKRASMGFNLPIQKSVAESIVLGDEFLDKNLDFTREYALEDSYLVHTNPYASVASIQGIYGKYYDAALNDQYTFDEAVDLIEQEVQILIDEGVIIAK